MIKKTLTKQIVPINRNRLIARSALHPNSSKKYENDPNETNNKSSKRLAFKNETRCPPLIFSITEKIPIKEMEKNK